jgi:hypothetical protein
MRKLLVNVAMLVLLSTATANAQTHREHRAGQPGYTPGGGVTVGTPGQPSGGRYGVGGGRYSGSKVVKVQPAPNVPHERNWGIPSPGNASSGFPSNVRDHRSVRR